MLKFKNKNDFSLVDEFKENEDGSVNWIYNDGASVHSGYIKSGMTTTWSEQTGTEQVSTGFKDVEIGVDQETGEPIFEQQEQFEEQPVFTEMTFNVYDELIAAAERGDVIIEPYVVSVEEQRQQLKQSRDAALNSMVHDYGDGRVVQIRPSDLINFQIAIEQGQSREWILADNSIAIITVAEMVAAVESGKAQATAIYDNHITALQALES